MKKRKNLYLEEKVAEKLEKFRHYQSELVSAVLEDLFALPGEEEIMAYRLRNGSFRGLFSSYGKSPARETGRAETKPGEIRRMW